MSPFRLQKSLLSALMRAGLCCDCTMSGATLAFAQEGSSSSATRRQVNMSSSAPNSLSSDKLKQLEDEVASLRKIRQRLRQRALSSLQRRTRSCSRILPIVPTRLVSSARAGRRYLQFQRAPKRFKRCWLHCSAWGLEPPPAILRCPMMRWHRCAAVLLGAVVPEMREQVEEPIGDLKDMQRVSPPSLRAGQAQGNTHSTGRRAKASITSSEERRNCRPSPSRKLSAAQAFGRTC